jgi:FkbM family methyltransferase
MRVPILAGALRGTWWLPQGGGKVLRILSGTYEPEQTRHFRELLRPGMTVLDVGAHVGYYTLLSARLVGSRGKVVAFEPNPRNCAFLRQHVAANGLENVTVEQSAVADRNGRMRFDFGTGTGTGRLTPEGEIDVSSVRLDDYCAARGIVPGAIKIDVEGAELDVLRGAEATIVDRPPVLFLSTHGTSIHVACMDWLRERGYGLQAITGPNVDVATEVLGYRA